MTSQTPFAWKEPPLTKSERTQRAKLRKAILLAQRFETAYRPSRTRRPGDREWLELVTYAHLVRAIQIAEGILRLRENPVQYVLMRVLCETFINLQYIESDPALAVKRARNFCDFGQVSRLRVLLEIARRFPHIPRAGDVADLKARLKRHESRFRHARSHWDWDKLDLVSRVEAYAKEVEKRGEDPERYKRIVALYQETNPYVHSGMKSMQDSITRGGGREAFRPSLRAPRRNIHAAGMTASLLTDLLAVCTRLFGCSAFDREIEDLSEECLSVGKP